MTVDITAELSCPSELVLDRLFVGELEVPRADSIRAHAASCARCAARLAERQTGAEAFAGDVRIEALARTTERKLRSARHARRAGFAAAAAAAAAVVIVLAAFRRPDHDEHDEPTVRRKGGLAMALVAKRLDGRVEPVVSPATLAPGEAIRFSMSTGSAGFLAIVGIDSAGAVTSYAPASGAAAVRLPAGRDQLLDGSIILDDTSGPERIVAVLCDHEVDMTDLVARARSALSRAGGNPTRIDALALADTSCAQTSFLIEKTPPGRGVE